MATALAQKNRLVKLYQFQTQYTAIYNQNCMLKSQGTDLMNQMIALKEYVYAHPDQVQGVRRYKLACQRYKALEKQISKNEVRLAKLQCKISQLSY